MTVYEFVNLCCDPSSLEVEIYDSTSEKIIFSGIADEIPEEIEDQEVSTFDLPTKADTLTINIDL